MLESWNRNVRLDSSFSSMSCEVYRIELGSKYTSVFTTLLYKYSIYGNTYGPGGGILIPFASSSSIVCFFQTYFFPLGCLVISPGSQSLSVSPTRRQTKPVWAPCIARWRSFGRYFGRFQVNMYITVIHITSLSITSTVAT